MTFLCWSFSPPRRLLQPIDILAMAVRRASIFGESSTTLPSFLTSREFKPVRDGRLVLLVDQAL